jgi:hypothetical protein
MLGQFCQRNNPEFAKLVSHVLGETQGLKVWETLIEGLPQFAVQDDKVYFKNLAGRSGWRCPIYVPSTEGLSIAYLYYLNKTDKMDRSWFLSDRILEYLFQ